MLDKVCFRLLHIYNRDKLVGSEYVNNTLTSSIKNRLMPQKRIAKLLRGTEVLRSFSFGDEGRYYVVRYFFNACCNVPFISALSLNDMPSLIIFLTTSGRNPVMMVLHPIIEIPSKILNR